MRDVEDSPATGASGLGLMLAAEGLRRAVKKREKNQAEWDKIKKSGLDQLGNLQMTRLPEEIARLISESARATKNRVNFLELSSVSNRALAVLTEGCPDLSFQKLKITDQNDIATLCKFKGTLRLGPGVKISPSYLQELIEGFQGQQLDLSPEIMKGQMESHKIAESKIPAICITATKDMEKNIDTLRHFQPYKGKVVFALQQNELPFAMAVALSDMAEAQEIHLLMNNPLGGSNIVSQATAAQLVKIGSKLKIGDRFSNKPVDTGKFFERYYKPVS